LDPRNVDLQDGFGQHSRADLLQELAIDVLEGYRSLIDFLAECGDSVEDESVVDDTIYQAAHLLAEAGEAYDLDLDRATAIIDRVSNHALPPWPSRAIASLILMSYGLLLRGVGKFIKSVDSILLTTLNVLSHYQVSFKLTLLRQSSTLKTSTIFGTMQ
jgi:hypothetical protein